MSDINIGDNADTYVILPNGKKAQIFLPSSALGIGTAGVMKSFELAVMEGKIPGYSTIDKFGLIPTVTKETDPSDIWEGGGLYNYDTFGTAPIVSLASNDAGDNTQTIRVHGLDINGELVIQDIEINGTNRVALDTALWRVYRLENISDDGNDLAGTLFCYTGTGAVPAIGDASVRALILDGNNQTQMAIYTVPLGKVGFLYRGEAGTEWTGALPASSEVARLQYRSRRVGKLFQVKKTITVGTTGNGFYQDYRSFPDIIPALTDIRIYIQEVSATMGIWATLDILLVDEDRLTPEFLAAIEQPGV